MTRTTRTVYRRRQTEAEVIDRERAATAPHRRRPLPPWACAAQGSPATRRASISRGDRVAIGPLSGSLGQRATTPTSARQEMGRSADSDEAVELDPVGPARQSLPSRGRSRSLQLRRQVFADILGSGLRGRRFAGPSAKLASCPRPSQSVDPVTAGLGTLAIVVTFVLWRKSRYQPRLSYSVRATPLVSVHSEARGRVALTLDGISVHNPHLVQVRSRTLEAHRFAPPTLSARFDSTWAPHATAISIEVADTTPPGLAPEISDDTDALEITGLLLNPGDSFTMKALVQDFAGPAVVEAPRIAGLTRVVDELAPPTGLPLWRKRAGDQVAPTVFTATAILMAIAIGKVIDPPDDLRDGIDA